jgi:hypothetical protein
MQTQMCYRCPAASETGNFASVADADIPLGHNGWSQKGIAGPRHYKYTEFLSQIALGSLVMQQGHGKLCYDVSYIGVLMLVLHRCAVPPHDEG